MKINLSLLEEVQKPSGTQVVLPKDEADLRVAVVHKHPINASASEPFSGSWHSALVGDLKEAGLTPSQCFLGVVCNFIPRKEHYHVRGTVARLNYDNAEVNACANQLRKALYEFKPDVVIGLGNSALKFLKPDSTNIDSERGAPFMTEFNCVGVTTHHMERVFMQYSLRPLVLHDVQKAIRLGREKWRPPKYNINFLPSFSEVCKFLTTCMELKPYLSVDIETTQNLHITCVGIAYNKSSAITIPFYGDRGKQYFSAEEHKQVWRLLSEVLQTCPLVGHNAVHFDHFALATKYRVHANFIDDTMFAHWERFCELEKSLGFVSSLYTDNPYWKNALSDARSGRIPYWKEYEYCAKDCIVTLQCAQAIAEDMKKEPDLLSHYRFNIRTSRAFQFMSVQGFKLNRDLHSQRLSELENQACVMAEEFSEQSGRVMSDVLKTSKELSAKEKRLFNLRSSVKVKNWLYNDLRLPPQTKLTKNAFGEIESKETADYLALLYLARQYPEHPAILTAGKLRRLLKRISTLRSYQFDKNGRMRWTFNMVGTVTGRASGYKPLDGIGIQPQNVDRNDRDLCLPVHEDLLWWKADLEGADSWTVAAQLQSLGHDRMMQDLLAGLKPAARLAIAECAMDEGLATNELLTAPAANVLAFKHLLKTPRGKIVYRVNKAVSHGTNYGMKKKTMHNNIFKQSDGDIFVMPDECERKQKILMDIYGLGDLHAYMESLMLKDAILTTAVGTTRQFFGRKDNAMLRAMLSHLPQYHTGLTTNVVISRLYHGAENRRDGRLIHLPACQVHDETNNYFQRDDVDSAIRVFGQVKDVLLEVWGVQFMIPWEAQWGESWGTAKNNVDF